MIHEALFQAGNHSVSCGITSDKGSLHPGATLELFFPLDNFSGGAELQTMKQL